MTGMDSGCHMVGVAQMVRAPGCGPGGRGFDSRHSPHLSGLASRGLYMGGHISMDLHTRA